MKLQDQQLWLVLHAMYTLPVGHVVATNSLRYHQYADDTQLYTWHF